MAKKQVMVARRPLTYNGRRYSPGRRVPWGTMEPRVKQLLYEQRRVVSMERFKAMVAAGGGGSGGDDDGEQPAQRQQEGANG